jgi:excisionase family DNA binding protein
VRSLHEDRVDPGELVTTGEAARLLNTSRQHIVDLCEAGDLPYVTTGTHRRIRRGDLEQVRSRTQRLTRDQRRSLWLSHAVAGKLVTDPDLVLAIARENLTDLQAVHKRGQAARWLDEWGRLLNGPIDQILDVLTSRSQRSRELRQNSPFATVLTEGERQKVLDSISAVERRG